MANNTAPERPEPIYIKNSSIVFHNFAGKVSDFNENGYRTVNIALTPEEAKRYSQLGWNVRSYENRDGETTYNIQAYISYRYSEPKILWVHDGIKDYVHEDTVDRLDGIRFKRGSVRAAITGSPWTNRGRSGISAYINQLGFESEPYEDVLSVLDDFDTEEEIPF